MQNVAGSISGLPDGRSRGTSCSEPRTLPSSNCRAETCADRSGTSDRDGLQSAALTNEPSGLLLCGCLMDKFRGRRGRQHIFYIGTPNQHFAQDAIPPDFSGSPCMDD
ncbi:hypothetical protein Y032_0279g1206 [Ancylostoma ceylanicum]|uniref:Uncharacterized protein n=1 Tax=Ancylostoma ceylanicum TaxID=53326 RepID=A0A016S717_9BILA|nr:hypothetical protein Y032_0279g1206 [Ancylostoma ceylanicum]